jgi:hypothetical protein
MNRSRIMKKVIMCILVFFLSSSPLWADDRIDINTIVEGFDSVLDDSLSIERKGLMQ